MWRILFLLASALALLGAGWMLWAYGPAGDLAAFARVAAVGSLLALAAFLPLVFSLRADRLRVPWRMAARFVSREAPIEAAILVMLAVSALVAVFPFGALSLPLVLALGALAIAGIAAATVQNVFGYLEPPEAPA